MNLLINPVNDMVVHPIAVDDKEGRLAVRNNIEALEQSMEGMNGKEEADKINQEGLTEYFVGGAYTRSLFIPKDTAIVSGLWKKERLWVIVHGEVSFTTELGTKRVRGPYIAKAPYGTKVALYAHEDTLWLAITGAESTNSDDVLDEVTVKDYAELQYPWDMLEHTGEEE